MNTSIVDFAKKRAFIPMIIISLAIAGWLFISFYPEEASNEEKNDQSRWSPKEDYEIKETSEGKFVVNEKAGLSFKVPEGWRVEIDDLPGEAANVDFLDKNAKLEPERGIFVEGCAIELSIKYDEVLTENTQTIISYLKEHPEESDMSIELIDFGHYNVLKQSGRDDPKSGKLIWVEIPLGKKLCYITTHLLPEEKERCSQEFDKFLETVLIQ